MLNKLKAKAKKSKHNRVRNSHLISSKTKRSQSVISSVYYTKSIIRKVRKGNKEKENCGLPMLMLVFSFSEAICDITVLLEGKVSSVPQLQY